VGRRTTCGLPLRAAAATRGGVGSGSSRPWLHVWRVSPLSSLLFASPAVYLSALLALCLLLRPCCQVSLCCMGDISLLLVHFCTPRPSLSPSCVAVSAVTYLSACADARTRSSVGCACVCMCVKVHVPFRLIGRSSDRTASTGRQSPLRATLCSLRQHTLRIPRS